METLFSIGINSVMKANHVHLEPVTETLKCNRAQFLSPERFYGNAMVAKPFNTKDNV